MRWPLVLPFLTLLAAEPAWALQPSKHRQLAEAACIDVGLPTPFCRRMGKEAFETDYKEWEDLTAHAQRHLGQARCEAADGAVTRVDQLSRAVVAYANAGDHDNAAIALGRALHTMQDECAHQGMTNEEHSFYSLTQACGHDDVSPDTKPEAIACADRRTREALAAVATALAGTNWDNVTFVCRDLSNNDACFENILPGPWTACEFLEMHEDWDGADSRWDGAVVGSALIAAFRAGLAGEPASRSACRGDAKAIDPPMPHAPVTDLRVGCDLIDVVCLGKTDEGGEEEEPRDAGCSTGKSTGAAMLLALMLAIPLRRRPVGARRAAAAR
jgi:hypothetical protein